MIDRQFLSIRSQGMNRVKIGVKDIIVCLKYRRGNLLFRGN